MLPHAVLFDMDGTLTDTEKLWFEAEKRVIAELGGDWKPGDELDIIGMNLDDATTFLVHKLGLDIEPAQLSHAMTETVAQIGAERGMPWRPGARELLELLSALGIPSALVTASLQNFADLTLGQAPAGSLQVAVTGDQVNMGKPHPESYLVAAERLGVDPTACVAFEDSIPGLRAALSAGAITYGVPLKVDLRGVAGATLIESLSDVDETFLYQAMESVQFRG